MTAALQGRAAALRLCRPRPRAGDLPGPRSHRLGWPRPAGDQDLGAQRPSGGGVVAGVAKSWPI